MSRWCTVDRIRILHRKHSQTCIVVNVTAANTIDRKPYSPTLIFVYTNW